MQCCRQPHSLTLYHTRKLEEENQKVDLDISRQCLVRQLVLAMAQIYTIGPHISADIRQRLPIREKRRDGYRGLTHFTKLHDKSQILLSRVPLAKVWACFRSFFVADSSLGGDTDSVAVFARRTFEFVLRAWKKYQWSDSKLGGPRTSEIDSPSQCICLQFGVNLLRQVIVDFTS